MGDVTTYDITFPYEAELLKDLNSHIGMINLGRIFQPEISIRKDFNEDLQKGENSFLAPKEKEPEAVRIDSKLYVQPLTQEEKTNMNTALKQKFEEVELRLADARDRYNHYTKNGDTRQATSVNIEIISLLREKSDITANLTNLKERNIKQKTHDDGMSM